MTLSRINRTANRMGIRIKVGNTGVVGACFVAGTLVALASGDLRAIEDLRVGDRVAVCEDVGNVVI